MIGKKITNFTLSVLCVVLSAAVAQAQSFNGSTTNTAGNSTFPSTGTGGCTVAPQNAGGTVFEVTVAGIPANAKLLSVQLNMTHTFDADLDIFLEAPGGSSTPLTVLAPQRIELSTDNGGGNDNYTNTVFCDAAATLISAGAAPFTGIFRPEGTTAVSCDPDGAGALTAYAGNIATLGAFTAGQNGVWKLRIFDDVGGDAGTMLGWSISFGDPTCSFSGVTLPAITIPGVDPAVCGATNASLTAPALACQTTITVFVDGTQLTTVNPGQSYIIPSLTSGVHIIKYSISACDEVSQTVTVTDGVPPTITCPPSVTINLDPGLCSTIFSYDISVSDNCPFFGPFVTLPTASQTQNNNFDGVTFDIQNVGTQPILITGFLAPIIAGAHTVNAYYTTTATTAVGNQANAAAWTFMGSANVTGNGTAPTTNVPIGGLVLQPGQRKGIYLYLTDLTTFYYANGNLTTTNGTLSIISNGHFAGQAPFINANAGRAFIGAVSYQTVTDPTPVQTAGLPSGSEFPKGTTTSCFQVADAVGNTSTCCFSVTVNEYANPVSTLVCNDFVYVSLDADCTEALNADQILEGGPYGCYDDYIVQIDKTPPFGNGPWVPAVLGPQDVGKTYAVQVTDPDTGNKCWGNLKVEDKLAPVLDCPPGLANCNQDLTPGVISGTVFGAEKALPTTSQTANNAFNGVTFDIQNVGAAPIQISGFIAPIPTGSHPVEVYYTTTATTAVGNQANAGAWTLLGTATVTGNGVFPTWPTLTTVPVGGLTLQPGDRKGIYVACADGAIDFGYANGDLTSTDGSLTIISQGHSAGAYPFINANLGRAFIGSVLYKSVVDPPGFPNDLMLNVNVFQTGSNTYTVPAGSGAPVMENCSDVTLSYLDTEVAQDCNSGLTKIVNRKWTAVDASGNTKTCVMVINVLRPTLNDVELPPSYDNINNPAVPCSSAYPTPDVLQGQGLQGYPLVFGLPDGCTIGWTYTDAVVEVCDGTYKILREWKVIDWCTGTFINHSQIIKVLDEQGPSISCPANLTVSTDPFTCCAQVNLPDVIISDNCSRINNISGMIIGIDPFTFDTIGMFPIGGTLTSFPGNNLWNPDTLGAFGVTPCLPAGSHTVVYQAEDDCGNTSTCTFRLTVRDYVPPVAACDEHTTVAIGIDDPFDCYGPAGPGDQPAALGDCEGAGVTWVKATTFDDGSYDNCSNIKMTIRRMPEADGTYSDCIDGLNSINGHPSCDDFFPDFPTEFERAISEGDSIKFYCCEVGTSQTVILRIYQLDDFGNFSIGPDGTPIFNECMIEVEVQDKIKPACVSPANVTVSCEAFDPSLWAYGKATVQDNCCLDTAAVHTYQGQCGLSHSVNYNLFDTVCNRGTITRTFRAWDCHGQSSQCTQRIIVNYEQDYFVKFPNDVIVTACDGTGNYGEPVFFGEDCELLGVSHEDQVFTVVPDACLKIERTWTIINWCTYNPDGDCVIVPNPNPNATTNNTQNLPGPTVSACGTPAPWNPTVVAIAPGQPQTNFCTFYNANANCYQYKQIIKIIDTQKPTADCPASPVEYCDVTTNDPLLWNQSYWWDAATESHDLCEGNAPLSITATDACSGANVNISYLLFLDLDGDGSMETVVSSNNPPAPGTVNYNNAGTPNYSGGTSRVFDGRPVLPNEIYRWANHQSVSGTTRTAAVQWKTLPQMPTPNNQLGSPGIVPQLPYGTHKIKWTITDGCGNETYCEYTFVVKDCKAPTVVCFNGLSVNIMPTQMVVLWATDFLQYAEDNCTPTSKLKYAIRRAGQGTGFPVDALGNPITSVTFTCADLGEQTIELWAQDLAGNADFCAATVDIQDNNNNCGNVNNPDNVTVAGALKTEAQDGIEDANVNLQSGATSLFDMSDDQGQFVFVDAVPMNTNYTVTPTKDDNPLNGVSTFDLVLISKHILGLEPLGSPYKMIAADANKSNSITTFDIVEIRKLILGIYNELPNNTSWRFVDKGFIFPQPSNPFSTAFPETKSVASVTTDQLGDDFVGVKIGDVNGTAIANALMNADDRAASTLLFDVQDRDVKAGEVFTVDFKGAEKVQGYQFTMNFSGLEVVDVLPGADMKADNFGVFADAITTSVDGESSEFSVKFRAVKSGKLSDMLGVSSRITRAEAYSLSNNRLDVALRFNGQGGAVISGVGFELYQNQPNPFVNKTLIGFHLPEATEATLSIFDETGRMLFTQKGQFGKGYNAIAIDRALLNTTGMMYYKLETATDAATKKMIQTK